MLPLCCTLAHNLFAQIIVCAQACCPPAHRHVAYLRTGMLPTCAQACCLPAHRHVAYLRTGMLPTCAQACCLPAHRHVAYLRTGMLPTCAQACCLPAHRHVAYRWINNNTKIQFRDREVVCSVSDRQGSNFEFCVWRAMSSHHPQDVLLAKLRYFGSGSYTLSYPRGRFTPLCDSRKVNCWATLAPNPRNTTALIMLSKDFNFAKLNKTFVCVLRNISNMFCKKYIIKML